MLKKSIPHILTLSNMACGFLAIRSLFLGDAQLAVLLVVIAALLDFLDGLAARLLGVMGELGKQLDSLADAVTFGVVPGFMVLYMSGYLFEQPTDVLGWLLLGSSVLISAMAVLRLAIFNIDTRQTSGFIGMPTPANTLFISSLLFLYATGEGGFWVDWINNPIILLGIALLSALWQVAPIPLIALKFKNLSWADNKFRYTFLTISALLLAIWQVAAVPFVILLYLVISIIQTAIQKNEI